MIIGWSFYIDALLCEGKSHLYFLLLYLVSVYFFRFNKFFVIASSAIVYTSMFIGRVINGIFVRSFNVSFIGCRLKIFYLVNDHQHCVCENGCLHMLYVTLPYEFSYLRRVSLSLSHFNIRSVFMLNARRLMNTRHIASKGYTHTAFPIPLTFEEYQCTLEMKL